MTYGLASSNEQAICSMTVFASAHIADHRSARQAHTWRRQLSQRAPAVRGLRWLKAMTTLGDARQGGFAVVPNRLRRQFAIAAWDSPEDFEAFYAGSPLADAWHHDCDYAWHVLLKPWRSSGSLWERTDDMRRFAYGPRGEG